ncbi:chromosome condensation complex Condensin, subunit G [Vermiconidia calcicola]|uniref:Chromosome condensation complex Condensin, subunit G n=1 Tax=Vermiconidia calcicola TaxID=1690605 RepID=A0ACC3N8V7_9PEZI|nr:chromosome condensation complex Condensin, subunit G [Vermiconidia calcicola]
MPGRVARGGRTSAPSRNASAQNIRSSGRNSSPVTEVPDEGADTSLRRAICAVFGDAQKSTAGHRKLVISLRKIQEQCCYEPVNLTKALKQGESFEEEDFNDEVVRCVLRLLPVRKAEPAGDRVVRFLGTFLNTAGAKDNEIANHADPDAISLPETPTSRLTTQILNKLLELLTVKDKTIRFRATQITSHIINSLDTLDDSLFHKLRLALLKRIHDKEAMVRLQAVYGLGRLAAEVEDEDKNDDDSDSDSDVGGAGVLEKLLVVLQNDPAAEVRRNLLLNLPLSKDVLPYLLERARDSDGSTRRALYSRLLPALGDFRHLSLTHREKLLRWGLRDRDENVRKATARLFRERWIEDCAALPAAQAAEEAENEGEAAPVKPTNQAAEPSLDALLELLERIDVVNSGIEGGIALTAMQEFWSGRPDYVDYVSFPDDFWQDLNPELAFVARTFNDFCRSTNSKSDAYGRDLHALVEEKLPEVTKFAFYLESSLNQLIETMRAAATGEDEDAEEESAQREFIVEQLLHMALTLDYSDEVGRRKMFGLMREALALPDLPEEATRLVVEILRAVCGEDARGESEFCGLVLEAIAEVHDTILGEDAETERDDSSSVEESFHSATEFFDGEDGDPSAPSKKNKKQQAQDELDPEAAEDKAIKEIMVNMKCLHIALCMLQNVACDLEENTHLVMMLNNLVVPAVRSQEAPIRERGLLCLGLCCLLGKNLAEENLTLFLHCFAKGHPALQTIALQIIADILITHPSLLATPDIDATTTTTEQQNSNPLLKQVLKAFSKSLKSSDPAVQATGATALSKTMLSNLITDSDLLKQLVVAFFDPDTSSNAQLKQSLSYFLPAYCHSRAENARRMVGITPSVVGKLATLREDLKDADVEDEYGNAVAGAEGMVKLAVVGQMLLDWTDPRKIVGFAEAAGHNLSAKDEAGEMHYRLAEKLLDRLVTCQVGRDEKKVLFSMLAKLHLPPSGCGAELLTECCERVIEAIESNVATDATSRNVLKKLRDVLIKMMNVVATAERGGGGAEDTVVDTETVVESTEVGTGAGGGDIMDSFADEEEEKVSRDTTVGATTPGATTFGASTIGMPDAEGTRVVLGGDDTEMMDVDDSEEYTEV